MTADANLRGLLDPELKWICKDLQGMVPWPGFWPASGWAGVRLSPPTVPTIFPEAWRGRGALVLAGIPQTVLSQFIRARKGAESGSRE